MSTPSSNKKGRLQRGLYSIVVVVELYSIVVEPSVCTVVVVESVVVVVVVESIVVVESHCVRSVVVDYTCVVVARLSTVNQL